MTMQYVRKSLDNSKIKYDVLDDERYLRVYYSNGDYTGLEITEFGDVCVAGKIMDFDELISRIY